MDTDKFNTFDHAMRLKLPCISHAKLELTAAAVELVVVNGDAVIQAYGANGQIKPEPHAPVVAEILHRPLIRGGDHITDIIKECEPHTHAMLLLDDRDAVFCRPKPVSVAADRFRKVSA